MNFIPLSLRKNVDLPSINIIPYTDEYGGYYVPGTKELIVVEGQGYIDSAIIHEYCHYLQFLRGDRASNGSDMSLFEKYSYNKAIRLYFRTQPWEMEALLLETKLAPNENNLFWLKGLVLPELNKFDENLCM